MVIEHPPRSENTGVPIIREIRALSSALYTKCSSLDLSIQTNRPNGSGFSSAVLLRGAGLVPIDDVDQLPVILSELKLELALFVDDQLGSRVENARALLLVRIVQVEFAGGQVVGSRGGVLVSLGELDRRFVAKRILRPVSVRVKRT